MYYLSGQKNVDKDLINAELNRRREGLECNSIRKVKLSNRFISWLFNKYDLVEFTVHFYDSEPEFDYDEDDDSWDYKPPSYTNMEWFKLWRDYEHQRIRFCNFIDVFSPGIWGLSDKDNKELVINNLKSFRSLPDSKADRVYVYDSYKDNNEFINIYCYSRDLEGADYWLTMKKKPVKKKKKSKKIHKKSKNS